MQSNERDATLAVTVVRKRPTIKSLRLPQPSPSAVSSLQTLTFATLIFVIIGSSTAVIGITLLHALHPPAATAQISNPIAAENALPGTSSWIITTNAYASAGQISGYATDVSVNEGGTISFAVSTRFAGDGYSFKIFRLGYYQGLGGRQVYELDNQVGLAQGYYVDHSFVTGLANQLPSNCQSCIFDPLDSLNQHTYMMDANWQVTQTLHVPATWVTGYYLVLLTTAEGKQSYIPFIVRDDAQHGAYLVQASVTTWQAYNYWGGRNAYGYWNGTIQDGTGRSRIVSYNRPYVRGDGAGDLFLRSEINFLRFVEKEGYNVSYTTNVDITRNPSVLGRFKSLILVGHDEYWSPQERTAVTDALKNGMDLMAFSGNEAYKKIRFQPDVNGHAYREQVYYRDLTDPAYRNPATIQDTTVPWRNPPINQPENIFLGEMWDQGRVGSGDKPMNFTVTDAKEWMFAGSGLHNGDVIKGIMGHEMDSYVDNSAQPQYVTTVSDSLVYDDHYRLIVHSNAAFYYPTGNSFAFDGGTVWWSLGLDDFGAQISFPRNEYPVAVDPRLQKVTENLLDAVVNPLVFEIDALALASPPGASNVTPGPVGGGGGD